MPLPIHLTSPSFTVTCLQPLFSQIKSTAMAVIKFSFFTWSRDHFTCGKLISLSMGELYQQHASYSNLACNIKGPSAILSSKGLFKLWPLLTALHTQCKILFTYSEIFSAVLSPHSMWMGQVSLRCSTVRRVTEQREIIKISYYSTKQMHILLFLAASSCSILHNGTVQQCWIQNTCTCSLISP